MPGFLATLVARAEGRLPLLERRPRALFEPAAGAPAPLLAPADARLESGGMASAPTPLPRAHEVHVTAPHREAREPLPALTIHHAPPGLLQPANAPLAPRADPSARSDAAPAAPLVAAPVARPAARAADASAPLTRASAGSSNEEPMPTLPRAGPPHDPAAAVVPVTRPAKEPVQQAGTLQHRATSPTLATVARARDRAGLPSRRDTPAAAAPAPAPVQISIGRVEIRAAQAATADRPRATGPAAPKLSLDDYLRGRNGAAR